MKRRKLLLSIEAKGKDADETLRRLIRRLDEALSEQASKEEKDADRPPEKES